MQTEQTTEQAEQTVNSSNDILDFGPHYESASTGKRFLNYLIDLIAFYVIIFAIGIIVELLSPGAFSQLASDDPGLNFIDRLVTLIFYAIYMSVVEAVLKGKSLGKYITQTRALNRDGSRISTKTAFARGFARAVPFCVFSAFGSPCNPWQDRWTDTMVIDEKKTTIL